MPQDAGAAPAAGQTYDRACAARIGTRPPRDPDMPANVVARPENRRCVVVDGAAFDGLRPA